MKLISVLQLNSCHDFQCWLCTGCSYATTLLSERCSSCMRKTECVFMSFKTRHVFRLEEIISNKDKWADDLCHGESHFHRRKKSVSTLVYPWHFVWLFGVQHGGKNTVLWSSQALQSVSKCTHQLWKAVIHQLYHQYEPFFLFSEWCDFNADAWCVRIKLAVKFIKCCKQLICRCFFVCLFFRKTAKVFF